MKHFHYTFIATLIIFTSCKNDDVKKAPVTNGAIVPFTQQTTTFNSPQTPVAGNHNLFRENNVVTTPSTTVVGAVNPAHGQPNHRCDIAVGAPLNSVAAVSKMNVQSQATQIVTTNKSTPKVVTAKGMNPPHGEKDHRCDIAVGAPLNSKPTTNATVSDPQLSPNTKVDYPVPALLSTNPMETKTTEETMTP